MEIKACKNCRRLFKYIYGPELCTDCSRQFSEEKIKTLNPTFNGIWKEEEEKFEQIKNYIVASPRASVAEISEKFDIIPGKLFAWIKEERIEFSDNSKNAWFACEKCGIKIRSGRFCNRCKV